MAEYQFRPALESESAQIDDLIHEVGINPSGLDWRRFIVAVNAHGVVVGCGQVKPHGKDILELASIAVKPEYRGQGIARKIIEILLERTPRPMYVKFGFRALLLDEMPRYFQRIVRLFRLSKVVHKSDEDLLVMKLE